MELTAQVTLGRQFQSQVRGIDFVLFDVVNRATPGFFVL